jgi:hypothetical protein
VHKTQYKTSISGVHRPSSQSNNLLFMTCIHMYGKAMTNRSSHVAPQPSPQGHTTATRTASWPDILTEGGCWGTNLRLLGRIIPTCASRHAVVVGVREPALSRQARAKACLGAQARLGRKVIFGTESVEQIRAGACAWKRPTWF